MEALTKF